MQFPLLLVFSIAILTGCSDKNKEAKEAEVNRVQATEVSSLPLDLFEHLPVAALEVAKSSKLEKRLEAGMDLILKDMQQSPSLPWPRVSNEVEPKGFVPSLNSVDFSFVDENTWYVAGTESLEQLSSGWRTVIDVWTMSPESASATQVANVVFDDNNFFAQIEEMYLTSERQQLVVRRGVSSHVADGQIIQEKLSPPSPEKFSFVFQWLDTLGLVDSKMAVTRDADVSETLFIDGQFMSSQRSGDILYVVSKYWAWQQGLNIDINTQENNASIFANSDSKDYMPTYRFTGKSQKPLSNECLIPDGTSTASAGLINITAIDLVSREILSNTCVNADVEGAYIEEDNIYLGLSSNATMDGLKGQSVLHKFSLDQGSVNYRASGAIPGVLQWQTPSLNIHKVNQGLHLVTTQRDDEWVPVHGVYLVHDNLNGELVYAGLQGSVSVEEPLLGGKELFETRFVGARAYLISEEETQPVAVVDLSSEEEVVNIGSLPLTKYFAHHDENVQWAGLTDDYILSVSTTSNSDGVSGGVDVRLLNIQNIAEPKVISEFSLGMSGSSTEVMYDLRGLSIHLDAATGHFNIALPASINKYVDQNFFHWDYTGLFIFDGAVNGDIASMDLTGSMVVAESNPNDLFEYRTTGSRSVFNGESIFHYYNGQVFGALRDLPDFVQGPY